MKIVYNIYIIRDFIMSIAATKPIDKIAQAMYNKKAYAKNKVNHNEICRKYYIINSEIIRKKRIERYYIQKAQKLESKAEYKAKKEIKKEANLEAKKELKKELKKEAKKQKLLKQLQDLESK